MRFKDKVAIITGGASGIGLATAMRLGAEGARVVIADIKKQPMEEAAEHIKAAGAPDTWASVCDVSDEEQITATVAGTLERFGRLDVIVNNAGLMIFKPIVELTEQDWLQTLKVDLMGTVFFIKQGFQHLPNGGAIVNVASIHAQETEALVAAYAAAKAGVVSLTRSAALEGKPKGIRVNAILPGAVDTPMLWTNPNVRSGVEQINPQDVGQPADIAAAIAFLASDDARFVQGAAVVVDGGRLARL